MHRFLFLTIVLLLVLPVQAEVTFDHWFCDSTIRLDYVLAGDAASQQICLSDVRRKTGWAGRRHHLDEPYLQGCGQVKVTDHATGQLIYVTTFSSLFREWLHTPEAQTTRRSFESSFYIPCPKSVADVTVSLLDNRHRVVAALTHTIDPAHPLLRREGNAGIPYRYMHMGKDTLNTEACIDVAILAEGYTADEMSKFYADAQRAVNALFKWEPFSSMQDRFNIVAVATPSVESGTSIPHRGIWRNTAFSSHFGTFGMDRYLTIDKMFRIYDCLADVPAEQIVVLINTPEYGGGGIYNHLTTVTSDHWTFREVLVHEFGHTYGGLADEYAYAGDSDPWYPLDIEPWEPNITTLVDFRSKWADLLPDNCPVPTPVDPTVPDAYSISWSDTASLRLLDNATQRVGVFEGAGYMTTGCFRPAQECRMKINSVEHFCPVCTRFLHGITDYYTR